MASHEEVFFWSRAKKVGKNFKKILGKDLYCCKPYGILIIVRKKRRNKK